MIRSSATSTNCLLTNHFCAYRVKPEAFDMIERTFGISRMCVREVTELEKAVMLMSKRIESDDARVDERARALLAESALLPR